MFQGKLPMVFAGFCVGVGWPILGSLVSVLIGDTLQPFVPLVMLLLLLEVGLKLPFCSVLAPITHIHIAPQRTNPERWHSSVHGQLSEYTTQLEALGFTLLTDYTFTTASQKQPSPSTARLFVHPQKRLFAELAQVENLPVSCSLSTYLENNWEMAVTNISTPNVVDAISHTFMRQPRTLVRKLEDPLISHLMQSLLSWREQVSADLDIDVIAETDADAYFRRDAGRRDRNRSRLLRSSMIWRLMEVVWFTFRPVKEWSGEYSPVH